MKTSKQWIKHFNVNALKERADWSLKPAISEKEVYALLGSLQAWQSGENTCPNCFHNICFNPLSIIYLHLTLYSF